MGNTSGNDAVAITIRQAVEDDVQQIGKLWVQLVAYHRERDTRLPMAAEDGETLYAARIRDRLDDSHTRTYVAVTETGEVVGFTLGLILDLVPEMFMPEISGFLADIYVSPAYRGHGTGRKLVEALMAWFKSRGVTHLELYVATKNAEGRAFWAKMGGRDIMQRVRVEI